MRLVRPVSLLVGIGALLALGGLPAATAAPQTERFENTDAAQTFVVPEGVTEVQVEACGAQGGRGASELVAGGLGARVVTTLAVTPGETLQVNVGGAGGDGTYVAEGSTAFGGGRGFNGGGLGGAATDSRDLASGGGGGGASDIRQGGTDLANRVIVAAGGGGSGAWTDEDDDFPDGPPGTGGDGGTDGEDGGGDKAGTGATQATFGVGGSGDYLDGEDGLEGEGGAGGNGEAVNSRGGGGGGGGVFGGGGGGSADLSAAGGGGGGSSEAASGTVTDGDCSGDGFVGITFEVPEAPAAEGPVAAEPGFTG